MNNYDAQCTGHYTQYYIIDRTNFIIKMREGMSIEEYWELQQTTRKPTVSIGAHNSIRPFLSYRFEVNGKTYYGTSKIGYSRDVHARMAGKPCKVYFQASNPYLSSPGDLHSNTPDDSAMPLSIASMVTGFISFLFLFIPFISIFISALSITLGIFALHRKKTNNFFAWSGIICSGASLMIGIIVALLCIVMLFYCFNPFSYSLC